MAIAPISTTIYSALLGSSPASTAATASGAAQSLGNELLAELNQSVSSNSTSSNSSLQDLVTLSAQSQSGTTTPLYNAHGLLQQVQRNLMLNDPLLQTSSTDASVADDTLLQNLLALNPPSASQNPAATTTIKSSSTAPSSALATQGSTDLNTNWAQLLQQNPTLAGEVIQSQMDQNIISSL